MQIDYSTSLMDDAIKQVHSLLRPRIRSIILVTGWSLWLGFDGVLFGDVLTNALVKS